MLPLSQAVWTQAQVRALDEAAIAQLGIPAIDLMNRAGAAARDAARARWPGIRRWLVLCGAGNNAGDGYVVARLARAAGEDVVVAALLAPDRLSGAAREAWLAFRNSGGEVVPFTPALMAPAVLVVDALLGTGLSRPVDGAWSEVIQAVNASGRPVLALDLPSGLDGDTGLPRELAIRADLTVTFVGRKRGLYLGRGPELAGQIVFDALGLPPQLAGLAGLEGAHRLQLFADADLARLLPPRRVTAHKGDFGHVLVIGGNDGMRGAVALAGEAALRAGAGLVSVATRPDNAALLTLHRPELMAHGVVNARDLMPLLGRATVVALGPGLGQDDWARELLATTLAIAGPGRQPLVLDADALNLLALDPQRRDHWILTPHPGEAGRLLGSSSAAVQADRPGALAALAHRYGGTVVLKGHGTLVGDGAASPWLIAAGNPGMATAGMGDVLTGLTAGLVAQTRDAGAETAAAAAYVHAVAADSAAAAGQRGLLAGDLLPGLRACLNPSA
ncbi:MAG: NAD(P)H-hydrate dehydratase [Gammaproteobacteria bacterium]|nr:NAD(P)H-hydrate dehydratase [Gammaproteobacteria bacterium]